MTDVLAVLKLWAPFVILSAFCVVIPIVAGASYVDVLIGYGSSVLILIILSTLLSIRWNKGLFAKKVQSNRRLDEKWAIVTGANSGIGYETAKELVHRGCNVIITCRSQKKIDTTIQNIKNELLIKTKAGVGSLDGVIIDLCSKKSIDKGINEILSKNIPISILINNAGAWISDPSITEDGIEAQWQANYLAPFYLTKKLLPNIIETSKNLKNNNNNENDDCRIINVASNAHRRASLQDFKAFCSNDQRGDLTYWQEVPSMSVYGDTKLAQILHAKKLQTMLKNNEETKDLNIKITSLHPGVIASGFFKVDERGIAVKIFYMIFGPFLETFTLLTNEQGAQTTLHCAISNENIKEGGYHANCGISDTKPNVKEIIDTQCDTLYQVSDQIWQ